MYCSHKRDKGLVLPFGLLHKKSMKALNLFSLSAAILSLALNAEAAVAVDPMFSGHMVLQRDLAVPVWGKAEPGEKVKVRFRKQSKETVANDEVLRADRLPQLLRAVRVRVLFCLRELPERLHHRFRRGER